MKGTRIIFHIPGEEPIEGVVNEVVTLPIQEDEIPENTKKIAVTYYQVVDNNAKVHTINPAVVKEVLAPLPDALYHHALVQFAKIASKWCKVTSVVERFNSNEKFNYRIEMNDKGEILGLSAKK